MKKDMTNEELRAELDKADAYLDWLIVNLPRDSRRTWLLGAAFGFLVGASIAPILFLVMVLAMR